jgi:hypothetical protein
MKGSIMKTSETAMDVTETIYQQLGGRQFRAMTGCSNRGYGTDDLGQDYTSFKIGSGAKCEGKRVNYVTVTLEASDTYKVEFIYASVKERTVRKTTSGIYADMLQEVFTRYTGFYTTL